MASEEGPKLSQLFDDLWKIYEFLETTSESTSSIDVQKKLQAGIEAGEKAIQMVNDLQLFSDNEEIEEVASNELRYLLLPALLGHFTGQRTKGERLENVKKSQVCYIHYLRLCRNYGLTKVDIPKAADEHDEEAEDDDNKQICHVAAAAARPPPGLPDVRAQATHRCSKIERFKQQKEYSAKLEELYEHVQKEHVDDEVKREYYTTLLKKWINSTLDELQNIESEIQILQHMAKLRAEDPDMKKAATASGNSPTRGAAKPKSTFQPFILTKNDLQKQVYGAGYPSMPTFSIEEFYEQRVRDGQMPGPEAQKEQSLMQKAMMHPDEQLRQQDEAEREKDAKEERDDPEDLTNARAWDDWKDEHRRGWGNKQNMG